MRLKLAIFLVGILVLSQIILYTNLMDQNDQKLDMAIKELDFRITNRTNDTISTEQQVKIMEQNKNTIPLAIIEGVKDPEKKFLEFMDYLDNSELGTMQGTYDVSAKPTIQAQPVPLQKTDFAIQFQFINAKKLESVLGYLLDQQQEYPLRVNHLSIKRIPKRKPEVYLDVSLLLPAKIQESNVTQGTGSKASGG